MTRKIAFFEEWSWFKFNNLGLVLGTNLKFCTSVAKGLKLKVKKVWVPNPMFVEVTGGKLRLTRGVCDTKWKIHEKKFQWNGWMFFRKHYCMKIFLHFGVILLCNDNIEKKAWKTFNSFKMQILLVYKYNKTGNGNSKTSKRKSRIMSFLKSLFNFI